VGGYLVHRGKPQTTVKKLDAIGPRTGNHYQVEDFVGTTMIVVHQGRTAVTLQRNPSSPGYHLISYRKSSNPETVKAIILDFQ
jgi:hypothetical protein